MPARLDWRAVSVGDQLPDLVLPMTATRVVAGALATRDFMPVHHDKAYANAQGAPEIFMNIFSDAAYCSRFLTDWAGPDAMLRKLSFRLGVPSFAGSVLTYRGTVTAIEPDDGGALPTDPHACQRPRMPCRRLAHRHRQPRHGRAFHERRRDESGRERIFRPDPFRARCARQGQR